MLKARAAAQASGLVALSDNSGLCVDALDGAPGIYSARWAGPEKDFRAAMARVERELRARAAPPPWRAAFVSVLALAWPDGASEAFEGRVEGILVFPPRGTAGFGYDPIFRPDGHNRTFGEMSAEEKHGLPADGSLALSHRARAFQKFTRARLYAEFAERGYSQRLDLRSSRFPKSILSNSRDLRQGPSRSRP